jgi:hypothetical protein
LRTEGKFEVDPVIGQHDEIDVASNGSLDPREKGTNFGSYRHEGSAMAYDPVQYGGGVEAMWDLFCADLIFLDKGGTFDFIK